MKANMNGLPARYLEALSAHLDEYPQPSLQVAHGLGVQAVDQGLETLDMARMHEKALASLAVPPSCSTRDEMTKRAAAFFTEAIAPIEDTHHAVTEGKAKLEQLSASLDERTLELADSVQELEVGIKERKSAEAALETSAQLSTRLLEDSRVLEEHLQSMARQILSANEEERHKMSLQLQDEIVQALVGINVRLLALKKEATASNAERDREIATIQQLVEQSVKIINQLVRDFGIEHERTAN